MYQYNIHCISITTFLQQLHIIGYDFLICMGFMPYLCYLYIFTYTGVQQNFHVRWCSCCLMETGRVSLVEQELLTLSKQLGFCGVHAQSLVFCVVFWRSLFILFVLFLLAIAFSVHPWFMAFDYSIYIFKSFVLQAFKITFI